MNVAQALNEVMKDVGGVAKKDRNSQQGFNFRGIDAVINAVGPALRKHGVIFVPQAEDLSSEQYETKNKTLMKNVVVRISWSIYGPEGDSITAVTYGEAADSGDKAVSKAHSVAYRTALIQTLCIPTDEPDPDSSVHERQSRGQYDQMPQQQAPRQPERQAAPLGGRTEKQAKMLAVQMKQAGLTDRDEALSYFSGLIGRQLESTKDLTVDEAKLVISTLVDANKQGANPTTGEQKNYGGEDPWAA